MSKNSLSDELQAFLEQYPETHFMDVFAPDINGILRGKRVQAEDFHKVFNGGANFVAACCLMNAHGEASHDTKHGGMHDGDPDIRGRAVPGSLAPVPWASMPTAQCLLTLEELDGAPYPFDPRNVLQRAWKSLTDLGLHPVMATELEFYLVEYNGDTFVPRIPKIAGSDWDQSGHQFGSFDDLDDVEPFLADLSSYCVAQNIPAGAALAEYSPGQYEVNLNHVDDPLLACDHAILLKRVVKAAARKNGLSATFMAKPFAEHAGSGMHIHISLLDNDGNNVFAGTSKDGAFSETLRNAIGGMQDAMAESMAVFAPNANSYRRFAPGWSAPATPSWGPNHRSVALRIPVSSAKNRRIEHRVSGADANPYLVTAAIFGAIHHGITRQSEPLPMTEEGEDLEYEVTLPVRWSRALDVFEAGKILPAYFGEEYHKVFSVVRREENTKFHAEVSDRDYEWYLRAV